jgi:NTE family protein
MHMTEGLPVRFQPHRGLDCQDHIDPRREVPDPIPKIKPDMRGRLSRVRTDLDSFTDVESNCLMAHGYALSKANLDEFAQKWPGDTNTQEKQNWLFKRVMAWLEDPAQGPKNLEKQLDVAEQKIGKAFRLALSKLHWFVVALLGFGVGIAAFLFVIYWIAQQFVPDPVQALLDWLNSFTALDLIKIVVITLLLHYLGKLGKVVKYLSYVGNIHRFVARLLAQAVLPALLAIPIKIYLLTMDNYFLLQGRINK